MFAMPLMRLLLAAAALAGVALAVMAGSTAWRSITRRRNGARCCNATALSGDALAPGSALACLDGGAGETIENACENGGIRRCAKRRRRGRLYRRAAGAAQGRGRARRGEPVARPPARGARSNSTASGSPPMCWPPATAAPPKRCAAFALLRDTGALKANLRVHAFDAYVARYAAAWNKTEPKNSRSPRSSRGRSPCRSPAAPPPARPVASRYDFPSAASIPPVSIMNAEPPLPKRATAANARSATRGAEPCRCRRNVRRPKRPPRRRASIASKAGVDVQIRPDRQSRRDRLPHRAHRASGWACAPSRSIPRPTPTRCMCGCATRRIRSGRRRRAKAISSVDKLIAVAKAERRRLHPSRLRLPVGERRIRRGLRATPASSSSVRRRPRSAPWA